ncbi:MAG: NAD-dependent epimerase/dehydratase family protein [Verrucomicrobiota bacterium]|nr:NAD-dependent epimerase/dehydratase family protein [Verrucomicrobiota bacterium]
MPRILIAGCGYVGAATADLFHAAGWEIEGWTHSPPSGRADYLVRAVDLTNEEAVRQAGGRFDAVIQAASSRGGDAPAYRKIYLQAARNLSAVFPDSLLLFTSSTSVYAQTNGEWVNESSPANPERETGRILRETEETVLGGGGVVTRLAGVYGPGRSALLTRFLAGDAQIDASGDRFLNQIHRDDIASALLLLVRHHLHKKEGVQIYNVADHNPITQRDAYVWLATRLQRPIPSTAAAATERKRGNSNKRVSSEKLQALGWAPRYSTFEIAMAESILPAAGLA